MRHRGLAAMAGTLLVAAIAPAAAGAVHRASGRRPATRPDGLGPRVRADHRRGAERPARAGGTRARPAAAGIGDPVLPARGQRRLRRPPLRPDLLLRPGDRPPGRRQPDPRGGDADAVALRPRPPAARRQRGDGQRQARDLHPRRSGAADHARRRSCRPSSASTSASRYGGVPQTIVGSPIVFGSPYGFVHTNDGAFMGDEPNATSTWIPMSDHPADKATWTIRATVPAGLSVISNGELRSQRTRNGQSTFVWNEPFPMANYLVTADVGNWVIRTGRTPNGIPETVAADPTLPAVNGQSRGRLLLRHDRRGHRPLEPDLRPVPVRLDRRDRRQRQLQRPGDRLLARDADAAAVLQRAQHLDDRPRAGAPVVRRQRLGADVAQHLAQRGLRDLRAVPVGRAQGRQERPSVVPGRLRPAGRRRPSGRSRWPIRSATRCSPAPSTAAAA